MTGMPSRMPSASRWPREIYTVYEEAYDKIQPNCVDYI